MSALEDLRLLDTSIRSQPMLVQRGFPFGLWIEFVMTAEQRLPYGDPYYEHQILASLAQWAKVIRFFSTPLVSWDGGRTFHPAQQQGGAVGSWEGFFSSPGGTLDYMNRVDGGITALGAAMMADPKWSSAPSEFTVGWADYVAHWKAFYTRNQGFLSRTFADVWDETVAYEKQLASWRAAWEKLGGRPTTPPLDSTDHGVHPPDLPDSWHASAGTKFLVGGVIAAAILYMLK